MADARLPSAAIQDAGVVSKSCHIFNVSFRRGTKRAASRSPNERSLCGRFVDGVTTGVAGGDAHFAQQQHGGAWRSIRNAARRAVQKKPRQRRFVCIRRLVRPSQRL